MSQTSGRNNVRWQRLFVWFFGLGSLVSIGLLSYVVFAVPVLQIRITLDSQVYNVGSKINIYSNITLDGNPTANLEAIEVVSPHGDPYVIRTVKTGNVSQMYSRVQISSIYTSASDGTPKVLFNRGDITYVNITIGNLDFITHHIVVGLYVQGSDGSSIHALFPSQDDINANSTIQYLLSLTIPSNAALGQARVFASIFTDFPVNSGYAYCPEEVANFSIGASTPLLPQQPEYSTITFDLPRKDCRLGNYTAYAVTNYNVLQTATDSQQFKVILLGDVNKDNVINMRDINALILIFNARPQSPSWNPDADLNKDEVVNMRDIIVLISTFQSSGIS